MRYFLLLILVLIHISLPAQKMTKVRKSDPDNAARITEYELISGKSLWVIGMRRNPLSLKFRIIETKSGTIELNLKGETSVSKFDLKKGYPFEIYFTDSSKIILQTARDEPATGYYDKDSRQNQYFANAYFDLDKEMQQLFMTKEVATVSLAHGYLKYGISDKKSDWIGKALQLFR